MFAIGMDDAKVVFVDGVPIPFVVDFDEQAGRVRAMSVDDELTPQTTLAAQASDVSDADRLSGVMPEMAPGQGGCLHTVYVGRVTIGACDDAETAFKRGRSALRQFDQWPSVTAA